MSREIRFRAWSDKLNDFMNIDAAFASLKSGEVITDNYESCESQCAVVGFDDFIDTWTVDLEQFTGLQDRNGVDIYEGDILNRCFTDGEIIGTAEWCKYRAGFIHRPKDEKSYGIGDSMTNFSSFEVIGNIHQNPELLEVKS